MGLIHISGQVKLAVCLLGKQNTHFPYFSERAAMSGKSFACVSLSGHQSTVSKHLRGRTLAAAMLEGNTDTLAHNKPLTATIAAKLPPVSDD